MFAPRFYNELMAIVLETRLLARPLQLLCYEITQQIPSLGLVQSQSIARGRYKPTTAKCTWGLH